MRKLHWIALGLACACGGDSRTQMVNGDMARAGGGDLAQALGRDMAQALGLDMAQALGRDMAQALSKDMAVASGSIPGSGSTMSTGNFFIDPTATPDNTPAQALPEGTVTPMTGTIMLWITQNTFTTTDQTDYAVFTAAGDATFQLGSVGVCSEGATAVLSKIGICGK